MTDRVTANKRGLLAEQGNVVAVANPFWLFTPGRFDLLAKYRCTGNPPPPPPQPQPYQLESFPLISYSAVLPSAAPCYSLRAVAV